MQLEMSNIRTRTNEYLFGLYDKHKSVYHISVNV
jgi:hypothetical protein